MASSARRFVPHAIFVALLAFAFAWSSIAAMLLPLPDGPNDFNSPRFIVRHSWEKFAYLAVRPIRGDLSASEKDANVGRFFALNRMIDDQDRVAGDPASAPDAASKARAASDAMRSERGGLQNTVQVILEGRLTEAIKDAGLTRHFGGDVVWPPVNIEFENPPSVLVKSPRSEIRKQGETLLRGELPIERVQSIESKAESDGETSALVVEIGGIAMYPAIIPLDSDYHVVLQDIAHEWTHHYLYFTPLGRNYFASAKLTTLNETVADAVGRELGDYLFAKYPPAPASTNGGGRSASPPVAGIDFVMEMRDLRRQVEALLRDGKIDEAEQLMEQKRQLLALNGYYIRRLNQAYFAFHGSYADSAGSIDPIGPKLTQLRQQSGSLKQYLERARELTSESDLDQALATR
ncbi:MAG: hypothetical protein M3P30_06880 [Chloroflexota bacterium]|nr:hypothetical protein [Chloroflexota bacterium]